jgi:hypothetical protein
MTAWDRIVRLFLATAFAATVAGCGSSSTGRISADAVHEEVRDFAGPDAKLYASQVQIKDADDGKWRSITVFTACKPEGGCEIVAPDGAGYPDFQHFVDDTKLINRGDEVLANADMTSPKASARLETFKKSAIPAWAWYAGGGALVVVLLLTAIWLGRKMRRRADEKTLPYAEETQDGAIGSGRL